MYSGLVLCLVCDIFTTMTSSETCLLLKTQTYSCSIQTHIQPYWAYLEPCVNIAYSEPCNIQKPIKFRTRIYSKLCQGIFWHTQKAVQRLHIESFTIFRTSPYLERTKAYSEPCQISKMENLKKLVKGYNCSSTTFHLSNLERFWACLHLNNS